ncbi:Hypothetical predicted protein [Pelobates cultripes]|uniref:Phospholipid scramblase n=1 Tax=Pelobates cultripes TaxID=61616 RepID=A0AAD1RIP9_PELCU|nr:Hypothetical predicted protein [Pelobates cultripes]
MAGIPLIPPGLEHFLGVDKVHVKETRESLFQSYSTFDLLTADDRLVYRAEEQRDCCGPRFDIRIRDIQGYDVFNALLPSDFCSCETRMVVSVPTGMPLGYIDRSWGSLTSSFTLLTSLGEPSLKVHGGGWSFMSDKNYEITAYNDNVILGVITHVWRGVRKEMLSSKDYYTIQFPSDLDVKIKALLVACAMLIDYLHREQRRQSNNSS